jgi:putative transposase
MDATVLSLQDGTKAYLQLILDNFSRRIIACQVEPSPSALHSEQLLRSAFASIADTASDNIDLIVDGGSENNNRIVEAFLTTTPIRKLIARVDVSFSNSMIEAVNKILKYDYLFRSQLSCRDHLDDEVRKAIDDYNDRPHYALKGFTPNQAYSGMTFDEDAYRRRLASARAERLRVNRLSCNPCRPLNLDGEGKEEEREEKSE